MSTFEGVNMLSKDLRHAVKDIMKTDSVRECRLIPTSQDIQEQSISQSGSLADDDTTASGSSPNTKKMKEKKPIQFKNRLFDVDAGLPNLKIAKALYEPNEVYRTPAALMTAKERARCSGSM